MIVEYVRYTIENERQREFENAYERAEKPLKASPHCMQYELSHCVEEPKNYILRIEWDSENGHLKGFRTSPEFQSFFEAVRPFFNDIEEMHHYEVTQVRSGVRNSSNG